MNNEFRVRETDDNHSTWTAADGLDLVGTKHYINKRGEVVQHCQTYTNKWAAKAALELYLGSTKKPETKPTEQDITLIPVSHSDYMFLSDAYDAHSKNLMGLKGEEYAIAGDFLAMENRLAGMLGDTPEYVSLVMAGKHITALGIVLEKNDVNKINLAKLDERVRDATNLLKIMAAFVHAKQSDFSLHLGKEEKIDHTESVAGGC